MASELPAANEPVLPLCAPHQNLRPIHLLPICLFQKKWKPEVRAKPNGGSEGNEAQTMDQEDVACKAVRTAVRLHCPLKLARGQLRSVGIGQGW